MLDDGRLAGRLTNENRARVLCDAVNGEQQKTHMGRSAHCPVCVFLRDLGGYSKNFRWQPSMVVTTQERDPQGSVTMGVISFQPLSST